MTPRRIQLRRTKGCANHPAPSSSPARTGGATPTAWPSAARSAPSPCTAWCRPDLPCYADVLLEVANPSHQPEGL